VWLHQVDAPLHEALQQHKAHDDCPTAKQLFPALQHALQQQAAVADAEAAAAAVHNSMQPADADGQSSSMSHTHGTRGNSIKVASQQAIAAAAAASACAAAAAPITWADAFGVVAVLSDATGQLQEELAVAYICKAAAGQVSTKAARQLLHNKKQQDLEIAETRQAISGMAGGQQQQQQQQQAEGQDEPDMQAEEAGQRQKQQQQDESQIYGSNGSSSQANTDVPMVTAATGNAPHEQQQQQCLGCKRPADQSDTAALCQMQSISAGESTILPGAAQKRHKGGPLEQQQHAHADDDASNAAAVAATARDQDQPRDRCDADPTSGSDTVGAVLSPGLGFLAEAVQQMLASWLLDLVQQQLVLLWRRQLLIHQAVLLERQDLQATEHHMQQDEQQQQQQQEGQQVDEQQQQQHEQQEARQVDEQQQQQQQEGQQIDEQLQQQQQDQHQDDPQPRQNQHQHHRQQDEQQTQQQHEQQQQQAQHLGDESLPVEVGVVEAKGGASEQQAIDELPEVQLSGGGQHWKETAEQLNFEQQAAATAAVPVGALNGSCSSQICLAARTAEPCCGGSADTHMGGQDCSSQQQPELQQQHSEQPEQQHQQATEKQATEKQPLLWKQMEPEHSQEPQEQHHTASPAAKAGLATQAEADSPNNSSSAAEACDGGDIKVPAVVLTSACRDADISTAGSGDSAGTAADCTGEGAAAAAAAVVHCTNNDLHDQQQQQQQGCGAGTTSTAADVPPASHLQQPQLLTEQQHEQQQSQQQVELPRASPATATHLKPASAAGHKQQQQPLHHLLDSLAQQTSPSTRDATAAEASGIELSTLQQQQQCVVLPRPLQPTACLQPLGGTVLQLVHVLPGQGYVAHVMPRLHLQQQLMMLMQPQQHMLQPQQLVLPLGQVQAPCLRPVLQPLQATTPVAQQQQQHMLLPQHKVQLQLALMQRARELQQQQQLQQGVPLMTSPAAAAACGGMSGNSMPQISNMQQQKAVVQGKHKHKAAKRCLGRATAHKAAARGSVKWRHQQAAVQDTDCQDPAMLAALPVAMPAPAAEEDAAGPVAAGDVAVAGAAKRPAAGRASGGKKKRSRSEHTKPALKVSGAAAAGTVRRVAAAAAADSSSEHDDTEAAPAADDDVLQPPHKRASADASATAAAVDNAPASTDMAAAADDAAALATLPHPQGAPVKPSVLLRVAPICLSQGAILSLTADPLLRAMLLEQPALMRAVQAFLHKVCVVWRRQQAHHQQQQGLAAADTGARAAVEFSAAEQRVFDLQHPSADLVCWDTLDRMVQHPSSIQVGSGSGTGPSWQQQQRQRQPLYPTDDAGAEGDEAAAAAGGDGAVVESDEEEVEYLSSLALAREVRDGFVV
jgi:hypothetical protein